MFPDQSGLGGVEDGLVMKNTTDTLFDWEDFRMKFGFWVEKFRGQFGKSVFGDG